MWGEVYGVCWDACVFVLGCGVCMGKCACVYVLCMYVRACVYLCVSCNLILHSLVKKITNAIRNSFDHTDYSLVDVYDKLWY